MAACPLAAERVWIEKSQYQEAEKKYFEQLSSKAGGECTLVNEIAKARQHIKNSLERMDGIAALASTPGKDVLDRISTLEKENASLREIVEQLKKASLKSDDRINKLESQLQSLSLGNNAQAQPAPAATAATSNDDDDGVDLFGSDSEDEDDTAAKVREQRLAEYAAKKSKKPVLIAKSNVILDVKPWDDETDMKQMETEVRKIETEGLLWGASKLVPLAFGIHKLSISCVVEDDKVSIDWLTEEIEKLEDLVQSVDVAAFNKI